MLPPGAADSELVQPFFCGTRHYYGTVKYTETDYYSVTKAFLNKHEKMLGDLMNQEGSNGA